jgi:hypothetical protein
MQTMRQRCASDAPVMYQRCASDAQLMRKRCAANFFEVAPIDFSFWITAFG